MVSNNNHNNLFVRLLFIAMMSISFASGAVAEGSDNISEQRQVELHNLLLQDCGSCHGMTMKGGLGPALTAEALKNRPRQVIEATISDGRSGTPMPPWNTILTKDEIRWIVDTLYTGIKL